MRAQTGKRGQCFRTLEVLDVRRFSENRRRRDRTDSGNALDEITFAFEIVVFIDRRLYLRVKFLDLLVKNIDHPKDRITYVVHSGRL